MKKKAKIFLKWLSVAFLIVLIIAGAGVAYAYNEIKEAINSVEYEELEEIEIQEEVLEQKKDFGVKNIALFGVDSREGGYTATRSDAMMVLSLNEETGVASITSVVRDTYAFIDQEHGYQKINHAYAYGGPALAIEAINNNFDLDIEKYVTVNFNVVAKLIDILGGVEVTVEDYEINEINRVILEMQAEGVFDTAPTIPSIGTQVINGQQAVAYMRIRKVGDGDYERMERQREVIQKTALKLAEYNKTKLFDLMQQVAPYIKTNLTTNEIIDLGMSAIASVREIKQYQLPSRDIAWGGNIEGVYYLVPKTLEDNIIWWHNEIYGVETYRLSELATRINNQIQHYTGVY